ncbi:MAG: hypothetical protein KIH67_002280 [Candidatus Moranbacteria bacterium]|nr:hypothetical protein [Candidatus Moranbacteria bacterium]
MRFTKNEISFYILTAGIFGGIACYLYKFQYSLVSSAAFSSFITLLVGSIAIFLYLKQKSDAKVQAARVILLEIRTAEDRIRLIKEMIKNQSSDDLPLVFTTKSWKVYSHLFVSDFDSDELKLINSFYDYGDLIEEFGKKDNNFFWVNTEEKAKVLQQIIGQVIEGYYEEGADIQNFEEKIVKKLNFIRKGFDSYGFTYSPQRTVGEMQNYLEKIDYITTSTCGAKLKKIAKM